MCLNIWKPFHMGRSEDIPCERPLGLSHGLAVSWLGWPGLLGWPGWLAVLAWECVASSHGQAMGSPMRKGCEDGNGGSGSYFTWGGHRTPHVKRLGCLAGWTGRVGWLAWHAGWLPGRAGWPGWLAWQAGSSQPAVATATRLPQRLPHVCHTTATRLPLIISE